MTGPVTDMPIIILAAGQSTRMRGLDKLIQMVEGKPLIRRQADLARAVTTGPVIVALPDGPHPRRDALRGAGVTPLPVPDAAEGMNASLRRAFTALPDGAAAAMLLLADLPDLTENDLKTVLQAHDRKPEYPVIRGATEDGKPGHPVIFSAALFDRFAQLTGDSGGGEVMAAARGRIRLVPLPGTRARRDLDTPEDWAQWRADRANKPGGA
ncbi:nucleotidyltransferase family protein [Sedimentitalea sp. JM2-8]|uniref:Nucleotidyltransferase family protein n=1 Tax=Sedimentitalea xiamensis TaxID=3050037 RepID=A0ABT7FC39_9RHOB|nr:nucleotidyltransferase family protein [Sedimentitalea xiamensis]MDK3072515.1 nucleotidyltransferase family protein [Sedimentitalea xiamensis]